MYEFVLTFGNYLNKNINLYFLYFLFFLCCISFKNISLSHIWTLKPLVETFALTEKARENSWRLNGRFSNVDWLKGKTSGEKSLEFQYKPLESSFRFDFFYL